MTDTPLEQAKRHGGQAEKEAGKARAKLEGVEREADEVARAIANRDSSVLSSAALALRWQTTIAAAQAHATLALSERVVAVAGLLEGLATPHPPVAGTEPLSGLRTAWEYDAGAGWLPAHDEAAAGTLAGSHGRVRSRVVGAWHERPAR